MSGLDLEATAQSSPAVLGREVSAHTTGSLGIDQADPAKGGVLAAITQESAVTGAHACTLYYKAEPAGEGGVALNLISDNKNNSCVFVTGANSTHATIKLTHTNKSGTATGDSGAACLNLNIVKGAETGTACQGLRIGSEEAEPNATGAFITAVRGTGGSLKNLWRLLGGKLAGVTEVAEAEEEPGDPESGKVYVWFEGGKMYAKKHGGAKKEVAAL